MTVKTQQFYYNLLLQGYMFRLLRFIIRPSNKPTQNYRIPSTLWDPVALTIGGVIVSIIPCSTASSSASITSSPVYLTVRINCPPKSKFSDTLRSPLIMYSLCNFNTIGEKHYPTLTHISIFTVLAFLWSSLILTL
jgi:hypothetical protein